MDLIGYRAFLNNLLFADTMYLAGDHIISPTLGSGTHPLGVTSGVLLSLLQSSSSAAGTVFPWGIT